jgi:hypothetical protein
MGKDRIGGGVLAAMTNTMAMGSQHGTMRRISSRIACSLSSPSGAAYFSGPMAGSSRFPSFRLFANNKYGEVNDCYTQRAGPPGYREDAYDWPSRIA